MIHRASPALVGIALATLALSVGCGDSGGSSGGGGNTGDGGGAAGGGASGLCQDGKVSLSGDVDGVGIELGAPKTGHALVQTTDPATYAIQFDGGNLYFEWTGGPIADGATTPVTGTVRVNGSTYCFASGMLTLHRADGFDTFQIGDLSASPDDGVTCPGTAVTGSFEGCADAD